MIEFFSSPRLTPYALLMLLGVGISLFFWARKARQDERLIVICVAALAGAFLGAKVVYLLAEGWTHWGQPDFWPQVLTGKTIVGALLGGYAMVEVAKHFMGYRQATGDSFAVIAPVSILLGRIGCWLHGCCLGVACGSPHWLTLTDLQGTPRWPAVPAEIVFNLAAITAFVVLRRQGRLPGQHFHLYLIAYGTFRFFHEWLRDTPDIAGPVSGYQVASLGLVALGAIRFRQRARAAAPRENPNAYPAVEIPRTMPARENPAPESSGRPN